MKNLIQSINILLFLMFIVVSIENASGNTAEKTFERGIEQYQAGQFFEAIESFEKILEQKLESFETYYNLGNAYFKTNQLPSAIYYYEKALQIRPHNEDALHNLALTNSLIHKESQIVPEAFHIRFANKTMKLFSPNGWAVAGVVFFTLTLVCIVFFLLQTNTRIKRFLFYLSMTGVLITSGTWYFGDRVYKSIVEPNHAIIMVVSAGIKSSPDKSSADVYVAPSGTKVKIISKLGDWYEVRVPDGNKGWILSETVRLI